MRLASVVAAVLALALVLVLLLLAVSELLVVIKCVDSKLSIS